MYFNELVEEVNEKMELSSAKYTAKILSTAFEIIKAEVTKGNEVRIHNFGTFKITKRKEREGRNPQTGDKLIIPARKLPIFKPSKTFKDLLNG